MWLLGQCYRSVVKGRNESGRGGSHPSSSSRGGAQGDEAWIEAEKQRRKHIMLDFASRLWMTYRTGFPRVLDSKYTSDAGWGCMLRSCQMMMSHALLCHYLSRDWRRIPGERPPTAYLTIVRWFLDSPMSPYSVHNLVAEGVKMYGKAIGEWYGPSAACNMLK